MTPQSAAIPYRVESGGHVSVLLVTSRTRRRWILPKGKIARGLMASRSAERETYEEAGVTGRIAPEPIGRYRQSGGSMLQFRGTIRIDAFPLEVQTELADWQEQHQRQRQWFTLSHARRVVKDAELRQVLEAFERWIKASSPARRT